MAAWNTRVPPSKNLGLPHLSNNDRNAADPANHRSYASGASAKPRRNRSARYPHRLGTTQRFDGTAKLDLLLRCIRLTLHHEEAKNNRKHHRSHIDALSSWTNPRALLGTIHTRIFSDQQLLPSLHNPAICHHWSLHSAVSKSPLHDPSGISSHHIGCGLSSHSGILNSPVSSAIGRIKCALGHTHCYGKLRPTTHAFFSGYF